MNMGNFPFSGQYIIKMFIYEIKKEGNLVSGILTMVIYELY